ncbi:MAG: hypothetical protein RL885_19085 [Planctomycetota bacterium]
MNDTKPFEEIAELLLLLHPTNIGSTAAKSKARYAVLLTKGLESFESESVAEA